MKAVKYFNITPEESQLNTLPAINHAIDDIFTRLDRIERESERTRIELLSRYSLDDLAQIAADNSGRDGDPHVARYVTTEMERRSLAANLDLVQDALINDPRNLDLLNSRGRLENALMRIAAGLPPTQLESPNGTVSDV